ncbi:BA14K family protein [Caulobacter hibisci]|uniref:Lectin-like protein BA14k n=1 Tax=Caulobacter hibisci TaxID=2035993 RepID=A0ABS0SRQ0_9CAUL|nr:BA14K family protein [Caulobacter hibisci]MBI1682234.1 BA14K family protein [Caulobacter hibisci]
MRKMMLAVIGAALLAAAPAALAQSPQSHPPGHGGQGPGQGSGPGSGHGPGGPGPDRPGPGRPDPGRPGGPDYGHWDNHWGARPPAPPSHWGKPNSWYRHVRACQQRYRSYNPRTDTYRLRPGVYRKCRL